ncbi:DHA2 family efflux MFS transporter permease subunit [Flexivirga caeni]|uniref:DHA2 family efflux MFS transporter permease subunit n=1 Tax=Flexivirga caeni TaxID=2294115 RepID=A0A3M9M401_9MICO|nr:MFS transporter [Flexivirga caeni]RNI19927.1 DHA2 family efflux MFS transporter permease subunit [Flexivirga caeni]
MQDVNPWRALIALCIGFFMILVDSTIVSVATPAIQEGLHTDINSVVWVTSAYLLAYAVPLLVSGRLGDRFGPRNLYLVGLAVFTLSSLWCGLTGSIGMLIAARVVQGVGAAMMTPQTMAVITRTFPGERRGQAMSLWGAVAGVATLVGPVLGGIITENWGWEWIFYVNVPVGVIGFALAWWLVPSLPVHSHSFDWLGVALSGAGLFCIVFGIQEGESYDWGTMWKFISVPLLIVLGVVLMGAFVWWQGHTKVDPLVPLELFRDRNFSLANVAICVVGFVVTSFALPMMIYAQVVHGLSPIQSGLLFVPMALLSAVLSPVVGHLVDRYHPRLIAGFGLICLSAGLWWLGAILGQHTPIWQLVLPLIVLGLANAFMWAPISVTATRTLPPHRAGAGAGVYNMTRQMGAVIGSAAIAAVMQARLTHHLGSAAGNFSATEGHHNVHLPALVAHGFSRAMGESIYLPAAVAVLSVIAALGFRNPHVKQPEKPAGRHRAGRVRAGDLV